MRFQDIQPAHVKHLYFEKRGEGRGDRTVQLIHTVLNNVLKQAVREGLMGHNPVDAVERPNVEQTEHPILIEEHARKLVIASMSKRIALRSAFDRWHAGRGVTGSQMG